MDDKNISNARALERNFEHWCLIHGLTHLPAAPETVARYIREECNPTGGSIIGEAAAWAIAQRHEEEDHPDPTLAPEITRAIREGADTKDFVGNPITPRCMTVIKSHTPDDGKETDTRRWNTTTAMMMTIIECKIGTEEIESLKWGDLTVNAVTGRTEIRARNKSRQASKELSERLEALRGDDGEPVFRVTRKGVSDRIRRQCSKAGLGGKYSYMSCVLGSTFTRMMKGEMPPPGSRDMTLEDDR